MFLLNKTEHAMVTVYGDSPDQLISRTVSGYIPDKDLKILTPQNPQTLEQAAQNSVLALIGVKNADDPNLLLGRIIKENRLIACDAIAFCLEDYEPEQISVIARGFDGCVSARQALIPDFQKFLLQKISSGARRLSGLILEEEYRRVCDALSAAPASMIIFDADKRAVFISDHYFRTYPKIASQLVRGLSVYDAYDMMAREEGLSPDEPIYERLQRFWYNLEGSIEFTLADGMSYRLKAVHLPSRRGTVLMGQNISGYASNRAALEEQAERLKTELERVNEELGARTLREVTGT